jgi:hypothetical protein
MVALGLLSSEATSDLLRGLRGRSKAHPNTCLCTTGGCRKMASHLPVAERKMLGHVVNILRLT